MEERERNSIYSSTIATHILERENQFTVQIQNISIKKKRKINKNNTDGILRFSRKNNILSLILNHRKSLDENRITIKTYVIKCNIDSEIEPRKEKNHKFYITFTARCKNFFFIIYHLYVS